MGANRMERAGGGRGGSFGRNPMSLVRAIEVARIGFHHGLPLFLRDWIFPEPEALGFELPALALGLRQ